MHPQACEKFETSGVEASCDASSCCIQRESGWQQWPSAGKPSIAWRALTWMKAPRISDTNTPLISTVDGGSSADTR